jgi:hypothetical protein
MVNTESIFTTLILGSIVLFVISAAISIESDGLSVLKEISKGTDLLNSDTDGDGLQDNIEINGNTDPLDKDADGDIIKRVLKTYDKHNELKDKPTRHKSDPKNKKEWDYISNLSAEEDRLI